MKTIEVAALELAPNGLPVDSSPDVPILTAIEHVIAASYPDKSPEYCRNKLIRAWLAIDKAIRSIDEQSIGSGRNYLHFLPLTCGDRAVISLVQAHGLVVHATDSVKYGEARVIKVHHTEALKHLEEAREVLREWWEFVQ